MIDNWEPNETKENWLSNFGEKEILKTLIYASPIQNQVA